MTLRSWCLMVLLLVATPACLPAAITIERIWPDRMAYYPERQATLRVDVKNDSDKNQEVTLAFDLVSLLDTREEIARQRAVLAPHQTNAVAIPWNTGRRDYGQAAVVSVLDASGALLDRKEEVFSISDDLWKVALLSMVSHFQVVPKTFDDKPTGDRLKYMRAGFADSRRYYANYYEFFSWAPDDFFELAPEGDSPEIWRSGTMGYLMSRAYARGVIQAAHDAGIQVVTYLQPFAMGRRTVGEFRKHPDWFLWDEFGQPQLGFTHKQLTEWREGKYDLYAPCVVAGSPNLANRRVLDAAIDQIVASAKTYGFEGCRFDNTCYQVAPGSYDATGQPVVKTQAEADERTAWALDHLRDRLAKEISSSFAVGHNFAYIVRDLNAVAWDRIASKGWVIVDEMTNRLFAPKAENPATGGSRPWMDFVRALQAGRDGAWKVGGHYQMIGFNSDDVQTPNPGDPQHPYYHASDATRLYMNIVTFASGVHPYSYHYGVGIPRVAEYWKFATRYSAFLWDNTMTPLAKPESLISVTADKAPWWKEFVYQRNPGSGVAQTVIHLVNPPLHSIHENPKSELPAPIESIRIQVAIPTGCAFKRAVWLSPEPKTAMTPLTATEEESGGVSVVVPRLELWGVAVFEWSRSTPEPPADTGPTVAAAKGAEDEATKQAWIESTKVKPSTAQKWTVEAEAYNLIAEKVADPDAHNGFAVRARKGVAKQWYMVTATYSYRERFGKYRLTFRVKCSDNTTTNNVISIGSVAEGEGVSRGEYVHRELRGADFAAPNAYQEFQVDVLRGDGGYIAYLMSYLGNADVTVDSVTIERTGDTTDQELAEKLGGQKIEAQPLTNAAPKALWVQGLFHEYDSFGLALDALKIPCTVAEVDQVQAGTLIRGFPKTWAEIAPYSHVVLSDADPRGLGFQGRALLKAWVEKGGILVVTGGPYALGKGLTQGTLLDDLYPVAVTSRWDLVEGGAFTAAKPYPKGCPRYRGKAGSFWIQQTALKPGASMVLGIKNAPVLAYQAVGRGKVVVFMGTALENELTLKPFWTDPDWKAWLATFLEFLAKEQRAAQDSAAPPGR